MAKKINYYGTDANYIHLKFGDARKCYNFTSDFISKYPDFSREYKNYFEGKKEAKFKNPFQIVNYAFTEKIPVHFYYNFTDEPAKNREEIMHYLTAENSFIYSISLT